MANTEKNSVKARVDFSTMIEVLQLGEFRRNALRGRWLDQMQWMSGKARKVKKWHYLLRLTAVIGGLLVPALVNMNIGDMHKLVITAVSLLVAISTAVEEFCRYGEQWQHYRQNSEALRTEGWQFVQLVGNYSDEHFPTHEAAYAKFASRVEEIIQREVGVYVTEVLGKKEKEERRPEGEMTASAT